MSEDDFGIISKKQYEEIVGLRSPNALKEYSFETSKMIQKSISESPYFVYELFSASASHNHALFREVLESYYDRNMKIYGGMHLSEEPDTFPFFGYWEYIRSCFQEPLSNRKKISDYFDQMTASGVIDKIGGKARWFNNSNYMVISNVLLRNGRKASIFIKILANEEAPVDGYFAVSVIDNSSTNVKITFVNEFPIPERDFPWLEDFLLALV